MSVGETRANTEGAATEIDLGLRQMAAALESQRTLASTAHEAEWIAGQLGVPLGLAMGYLATAATVAERIAATSAQIDGLLSQLPANEVDDILTSNEIAGAAARRIVEYVEAAQAPLSFQGDTIAAGQGYCRNVVFST